MLTRFWIPVLICAICTINSYGQRSALSGKIFEHDTEEPIEYASIALYRSIDSTLVTGTVSNVDGSFEITHHETGDLYITVQFMGYENYRSPTFSGKEEKHFEKITLGINAQILGEVEVTGRAVTSMHKLDKQIFKANQFQNAQGGTATEILRNLPSVSINAEGQITVRGATGFTLMINGKPTQMDPGTILGQLPANAIEDVEIITAPSAKYDPDGKAGIINIKTKQGALNGQYLSANVQVGLPSLEPYDNSEAARRYNADVTYSIKKDQWDITVGADYRRNDVSGRRVGYVNTYQNEILTEFPSYGERSFDRENYSARATATYSRDKNQSITGSLYAGKRTQYRRADILYDNQQRLFIQGDEFLGPEAYWDTYNTTGQLHNGETITRLSYFNENLRVRRGDFLIGALDYVINLGNESNLKLGALYERTILGGPTDNISRGYPNLNDTLQLQFNDNRNPLDGFRIQADYEQKIGSVTLTTGYQFRYLKHPGDFVYFDRNLDNNIWVSNPTFTNKIDLRRSIHSLYGQINGTMGKLQYVAGLRLEYFDREVKLQNPNTTYVLQKFNPFPSINLQYDLGEGLTAKAGYSRRIQRTTTFSLTPFPEREHSETLEQGDAELQPEYIDLAELGIIKNWSENSIFATAFYSKTANVINRVNTIYNDTILNRIYTNAGIAYSIGLELGTTVYPAEWWKIYLGGTVQNYRIKGALFGDAINTSNTAYSINANADFKLSSKWSTQLAFNYLSERITAQGVDSRFYNPSLSIRKKFKDERFTAIFQWLNIDAGLLDSNEQRITTARENFYTTTNYIYEVDILMVGVSFQMNQPSKKSKLLKSEFGDKEF